MATDVFEYCFVGRRVECEHRRLPVHHATSMLVDRAFLSLFGLVKRGKEGREQSSGQSSLKRGHSITHTGTYCQTAILAYWHTAVPGM